MAMDDDVGAAFTGGKVDPATAASGWDDWLQKPGNRTALLQMGLQLMQPVAIGQTMAGHIGQAIGAGGEAITRQEVMDDKNEAADNKLALANARLGIAQQNADANTQRAGIAAQRATQRSVGGLTDALRARFARQDQATFEKQLDSDAKQIAKQANDILADPNDPVVKQYKGKTVPEIRDMLRSTRPKPKYGNIPSADEGEEETPTGGDETAPDENAPPVPGARLAKDGNWYRPDPARPGKWQLVK